MNNTKIGNPKVSVVMITYQHEAFIAEAIEGVLMQEVNFPVELIIAEDCSPDCTAEIVQKYIETHPKGHWIKYTRHEKNKGMMSNFIWSLKQAKGKYVALCEGDDCWIDVYKIKKQVEFLELNKEFVIHFFNSMSIDDKNNVLKESILEHVNNDFSVDDFLLKNPICTLTAMFLNIEELKENNFAKTLSKFPFGDWPLWTYILYFSNKKARYDKSVVAKYRIHSGGVCSSLSKLNSIKCVLKIQKSNRDFFSKSNKKLMDIEIKKTTLNYFNELKYQNKLRAFLFYCRFFFKLNSFVSPRDMFFIIRKEN